MIKKIIKDITPPIIWTQINNSRLKNSEKSRVIKEPFQPLDKWSKEDLPNKIYVHIHKCAGTSMWNTLNTYPNFLCYIARPGRFSHGLGFDEIPDHIWDKAFKFTIVRNPYDRVVSAYKMFKGKQWSNVFNNFSEFVEFIQWCDVDNHNIPKFIPTNTYVKLVDNIIHHCSSFHNPKYRINDMDYIGKLENLNESLNYIAPYFDVEEINLPQLNATKKDTYRTYYTDRTRSIIEEKYKADIERFDYEF
ncbi:sulfotransferase family 2 domain-containing protein [Winogradskyella sp. PG-2]|uniref:sulfotransferase family 2 domain-containing protein n=1 Tax=Winogradskyella sp. PG-2 TaxID=754409 RepID=UPI0004586B39|nr:sulfotransferase family 2 domain-containing protein [Winogradskyella sp. PG-2]BAO76186.1 hypothetical protein WPG_1956 [Winogradskyella sp. PG-2]